MLTEFKVSDVVDLGETDENNSSFVLGSFFGQFVGIGSAIGVQMRIMPAT